MKKLFLALYIVSFLAACNNGVSGGKMEPKQEQVEQVEFIQPGPATNISHVKDGDVYTVRFEHDGVNVQKFHVAIGCTDNIAAIQKEYLYLDKNAREVTFNYTEINAKIPCAHVPTCREFWVDIITVPSKVNFGTEYPSVSYNITLD